MEGRFSVCHVFGASKREPRPRSIFWETFALPNGASCCAPPGAHRSQVAGRVAEKCRIYRVAEECCTGLYYKSEEES